MHLKKRLPATTLIGLFALIVVLSSCSQLGGGGGITDPSSFSAEAGVTSVTLAWSSVKDATGYTLERKEGSGDYQTLVSNENKTGFLDSGLQPNTTYTYRVKAAKGSTSSNGKTTSATTKSEGSPSSISTLTPIWQSKTPVSFVGQDPRGTEISAIKAALTNVTISGSTVTMNGTSEVMYYVGGACTQITASASGSGTFRIVADDQVVWSGTGAATADVVGKQNVSLVFEGTGTGTWANTTAYCSSTPAAPSAESPFVKGKWGEVFNWGAGPPPSAGYQYGYIVPTHAANLPDGSIATWAAWKETTYGNKPEETPQFLNQTAGFLWNPGSGSTPNTSSSSFMSTNLNGHDMFCAGLSVMADGNIFAAGGGSLATTTGVDSQRRTSYFNIKSRSWEQVGSDTNLPLAVKHWYPTSVALPDNRVFVVGGSGTADLSTSAEIRGPNQNDPWVNPKTNNLTAMFPQESDVNIPNGDTPVFTGNLSANAAEWLEVQGWYPHLNVAPDGQLFQSGPLPRLQKFSISGTTITGTAGKDAPAGAAQMRTWGNSIMYDEGKILVTGGSVVRGAGATNTGFIVDINGGLIDAQTIPPMRFRRAHQNSVVLPTGDVLIIGGNNSGKQFTDGSGFTCPKRKWANANNNDLTNCTDTPSNVGTPSGDSNANNRWPTDIDTESVLTPELFSPDKRAWRDMAELTVPRNYHSIGILLKDGRVLAAGGGLCGDLGGKVDGVPCNHPNGQIFEPPYLFNPDGSLAKRPEIGSLNLGSGGVSGTYRANYGSLVNITMANLGDGSSISKFSMIKLSAVTHSMNTDVRYLEYSADKGNLVRSGNSYQITLTDNRNVLTPGYYFLFAINDKGVPSVAQVVQVN